MYLLCLEIFKNVLKYTYTYILYLYIAVNVIIKKIVKKNSQNIIYWNTIYSSKM